MKRLSLFTLFVTIFLLATACGGDAEDAPETANESGTTEQETTELPPPVITEVESGEVVSGDSPVDDAPISETEGQEAAPEPEAVEEPHGPWPAEDFGYGVQVHGNATVGDAADTMRAVNDQLGMDWVKMQVQWWLVHPDPDVEQWFFYDSVVEEAHKSGLNLMVSIVGAPAWTRADGTENGPPDDYNQYAEFLTELLQRYDGKVDAIEVWNDVPALPELISIRVSRRFGPKRDLAFEVPLIRVLERPEAEEELVAVRRAVLEARVALGRRVGPWRAKRREEIESVRKKKGSVVVKVVVPPVGDRRLWGYRLYRRMCVDHTGRGVEPRV